MSRWRLFLIVVSLTVPQIEARSACVIVWSNQKNLIEPRSP